MYRMKTLTSDLIAALPPERHAHLSYYRERLNASIAKAFEDVLEQQEAAIEDRQAWGGPRRIPASS